MSLISFSATRSRAAAWLALLAVLLLFVAPVISKSLAQLRGDEMTMRDDRAAPSAQPEHNAGHGTTTHQASDAEPRSPAHQMSAAEHRAMMAMGMMMPHHPMSMMDDSACGYCVLLIHLALTLAILPLLWCLRQAAAPPAVPLFQAMVARFVPRFFHPRAPPAFC